MGRLCIRRRRYRKLLGYALRQWPYLLLILALTLVVSGLAALQPWPTKLLVDYGLRQQPAPGPLRWLLEGLSLPATPIALIILAAAGSFALFAIDSALDLALSFSWAAAGQRMIQKLATDLFHRLQRLSLAFHRERNIGDLMSRLSVDTWCVYSLSALLVSPAQQAFMLAAVALVAWRLDPGLTLLSLAIAPLLGASTWFFGGRMKRRARGARQAQSRLLSFVQQTLGAIPLVQLFGAETRNKLHFRSLADDVVWWARHGAWINSAYGLANGLITAAGMAVVLFAGAARVLENRLSVGDLLVFLAYIRSMQQSAANLIETYGSLKPVEASVERVMEILEIVDPVRDSPQAVALPAPHAVRGHVAIENVTFGYDRRRPILHDVSLEARPGETIALVGPSGGGKSTLVSLIPRFGDPWSGRVTFDGIDVRALQLSALRAQVSLVLQEPFLLPLTIAQNIAYGRPSASREEIVAAAAAANADHFIRRLPNGYDTQVGERGATLSGGERQRIAIARALLKNARVLILDEPTSALDAVSEHLLLQALARLMTGRTTLVIAHRLSTIRHADRIAVLEAGRIVELGTHEQLLEARGAYCRFHSLQSRGEILAGEVA